MKSFCVSFLLPLATIMAVVLVLGCEPTPKTCPVSVPKLAGPVAPLPTLLPVARLPKVVAFGADWCPACRAGLPQLEELKRRGVEVDHWNIDQHPELVQAYKITSIPVYLVNRPGHPMVRTQSIDEAVRLVNEVYGR
jgi:thiol-disulfide isomerase/thioredoxin